MPPDLYRAPVPDQLWERTKSEFGLPSLEQVQERLATGPVYPGPIMRRLFRVFIDEDTFCPGYQFLPDRSLNPVVTGLFERSMELRIPHNYFALWMMIPSPTLDGRRPVDLRQTRTHAPR